MNISVSQQIINLKNKNTFWDDVNKIIPPCGNKGSKMTNEQIIAECEKTLGLKVVEDIYPNCIYFIIIKFENGKMLSLDKMSNGGTAKGRRTFTNEEQMKEIKARCEDFIASSQNKTFWERYRDGDIRHIHISAGLPTICMKH